MFLYMNVYISDARLTPINRGYLRKESRSDVFRYMLSSLACIDRITDGVVRVEFDAPYANQFDAIVKHGKEVFGNKIKFINKRATTSTEWQQHLAHDIAHIPDDESVMFFCNDDHIFIDSSLDMLYTCIDAMEADKEPYKAIVLSHWPEHLKVAKASFCTKLEEHKDFITFYWGSDDSYQIVNARLLRKWFDSRQPGHPGWLPRSDGAFWNVQQYKAWVPKKELVRHFDGYGPQNMCIGEAPPLEIPEGFFTGNIRIDIGGDSRRSGWTLFNPDMPVKTTHTNGADYKWVEEDIPLFWRNKIVQIERNEIGMYTGRNDAIATLATAKHVTNWTRGNDGQPKPSWYTHSFIPLKDWAMIYYAYDTLTDYNYDMSAESLANNEFEFDTLFIYNASTQRSNESIMNVLGRYDVLKKFKEIKIAPRIATEKSVSADFVCQMRSLGGYKNYLVMKPDFYLPDNAIQATRELMESRDNPSILNFKKFDIREYVDPVDVRKLASLNDFNECLNVKDVKMWYDEPVELQHWALGFWGPDGVMHAYNNTARKLANIPREEAVRTWGYCSVLENAANNGAELFYDDRVYAMHLYHEVPAKHGPAGRMKVGYRY